LDIRARLRRLLGRDRPSACQTAFVRACLPGNRDGARDLDLWLTLAGGSAALAVVGNPFKPNLPALAHAIAARGEQPPDALRAVLAFTALVEPRRARRYAEIAQALADRMTAAGIAGFIAGDAAAAQVAYPGGEVRHIASIHVVALRQDLPAIEALCSEEGFARRRILPYGLELVADSGARVLLADRLFPSDRSGTIDRLLTDEPAGLRPLLPALLFLSSCVAGYPPTDPVRAPAMIDAAVLAPLLSQADWRAVAGLARHARREPLRRAFAYLSADLGIALPAARSSYISR
jgi:hypothetical protein